ncbi:hypothetical protein ACTHGU_10735 [Chitinophagaceae bacterium MMS25-I14]
MNSNVVAYVLYLIIIVYIVYYVGRKFHSNGRVFILGLMHGDHETTDTINNILLVAYYLFNCGYAFLKLKNWEYITGPPLLISSLGYNIGVLILILAVTHYFNMLIIYFLSKRNKHKSFTP